MPFLRPFILQNDCGDYNSFVASGTNIEAARSSPAFTISGAIVLNMLCLSVNRRRKISIALRFSLSYSMLLLFRARPLKAVQLMLAGPGICLFLQFAINVVSVAEVAYSHIFNSPSKMSIWPYNIKLKAASMKKGQQDMVRHKHQHRLNF